MSTIARKVWIVDDDLTYQNFISSYLMTLGYNPQGFSTGEECLKCLKDKPDIVILDHDLESELNGVDILRVIREDQPNIPVIYISGQDKVSIVSEASGDGVEDCVEKDRTGLIRLKMRLDKIHKRNALRAKRLRYHILVFSICLIGFLFALSVLYFSVQG